MLIGLLHLYYRVRNYNSLINDFGNETEFDSDKAEKKSQEETFKKEIEKTKTQLIFDLIYDR